MMTYNQEDNRSATASEPNAEPGCIYTHLPNGIHQFVFTGVGEKGLDEFFEQLEVVLHRYHDEPYLRYYLDATRASGKTSMREMLNRFRKLETRMPLRPAGRTAIVHRPDVLLTLASTFIDSFAPRRDRTRFFRQGDEQSAWQWLEQFQD